jgi:hypothetical protein
MARVCPSCSDQHYLSISTRAFAIPQHNSLVSFDMPPTRKQGRGQGSASLMSAYAAQVLCNAGLVVHDGGFQRCLPWLRCGVRGGHAVVALKGSNKTRARFMRCVSSSVTRAHGASSALPVQPVDICCRTHEQSCHVQATVQGRHMQGRELGSARKRARL